MEYRSFLRIEATNQLTNFIEGADSRIIFRLNRIREYGEGDYIQQGNRVELGSPASTRFVLEVQSGAGGASKGEWKEESLEAILADLSSVIGWLTYIHLTVDKSLIRRRVASLVARAKKAW